MTFVEHRVARAEARLRTAYGVVEELDILGRWGRYDAVPRIDDEIPPGRS
jgi:hypothetical protein